MKLYDLWIKYKQAPDNTKLERRLCKKIHLFAKIVLRQFKLHSVTMSYEDLLQEAFVCFFSIAAGYNPERSAMEYYFMQCFRRHVGKQLGAQPHHVPLEEDGLVDDAPTPEDSVIGVELENIIYDTLTDENELYLFSTYLREGVSDISEIAKLEIAAGFAVDEKQIQHVLDKLRQRLRERLSEDYDVPKESA